MGVRGRVIHLAKPTPAAMAAACSARTKGSFARTAIRAEMPMPMASAVHAFSGIISGKSKISRPRKITGKAPNAAAATTPAPEGGNTCTLTPITESSAPSARQPAAPASTPTPVSCNVRLAPKDSSNAERKK
ncbi:MAG TPA: hypothetical protein DEF51_29830 [Myxococcales bacterium]|nr:hypothetical protein [Myxococcales bacterium]